MEHSHDMGKLVGSSTAISGYHLATMSNEIDLQANSEFHEFKITSYTSVREMPKKQCPQWL